MTSDKRRTLTPQAILRRVPELTLRLHPTNQITIDVEGGRVTCASHALAILDTFYRPISFSEALRELQGQVEGAQDWIEMTSTIVTLYQAGVLREESETAASLASKYRRHETTLHVRLLNDRARTSSFITGINEVVRPGDVVVDIGTGTGVLAIAAARAGARHVYAVEASGIGRSARSVFDANGLGDRITLVEGWSTRIELPERADVLISEIIGNEPLEEQVLEVTWDALQRLLKPAPRLVPSRIKLFALPVSIPEAVLAKETFAAKTIEEWHRWYDIDFRPLIDAARDFPHFSLIKPASAKGWKTFSDPLPLADVDLANVRETHIDSKAHFTARGSGELNGIYVYFEAQLGPTTFLSMHPSQASEGSSWRTPLWLLIDPLSVRAGDPLTVSYSYRTGGDQRVEIART